METKAKNKTQLAYEYILSRIESGVYGPGYRVVIDQIARELGLSLTFRTLNKNSK